MKKLLTALAAACGLAASTFADTVNLADVTTDRTFISGDVIYGTLNSNVKLSIAHRSTVTLSNAVINGVNHSDYLWAGLTCIGDATIILADGTSSIVRGFYRYYPGIHVNEGELTIRGTGSLEVSSNGSGSGIGGAHEEKVGGIVIEGGNITATGGNGAAGIGGSQAIESGKLMLQDCSRIPND